MKLQAKNILSLIIRYLILVLIAISGLGIFYTIFRPLTVYPVYGLLSLIFDVSLASQTIMIIENTLPIEFVKACIAGAAYYLLLILNLATPKIKFKVRIKMILTTFLAFLLINILRIFILSIMVYSGSVYFDITHKFFWYLLSTAFVVFVWFSEVKHYKIKSIPFYSDIKYLYEKSKRFK